MRTRLRSNLDVEADVALAALGTTQLNTGRYADGMGPCIQNHIDESETRKVRSSETCGVALFLLVAPAMACE